MAHAFCNLSAVILVVKFLPIVAALPAILLPIFLAPAFTSSHTPSVNIVDVTNTL